MRDLFKLGGHFYDAVELFGSIHPDIKIDLQIELTAFTDQQGVFHNRKLKIGFPNPGEPKEDIFLLHPRRASDG